MTSSPELGTPAWLEHVWSSPQVDKIKGRSSWTQAHQPWSAALGGFAAVQGRGEYCSLLALEYLHTLRLVQRFKAHAFKTSKDDLGWEIRPDFFLQDHHQNLTVVEVKTARFTTPAKQLELEANRRGLAKFGLRYLVWSDQHPLTTPVRHNLINMRRSASEDISPEEIDRLVDCLSREGDLSLDDVMDRRIDFDCICAAWWHGRVFLALTREPEASSTVALRPLENLEAVFLGEKPILDAWWEGLLNA